MRPRLLDLFCGAGGASAGYHRAGFDVTGVDLHPQPNYPYEFIQADWAEALAVLPGLWEREGIPYAIHASPPCQLYTSKPSTWGRARVHYLDHPDLLPQTRERLDEVGVPYVIENVEGAPLRGALLLCGTMFGLRISKHRIFEANWGMPILSPATCDHRDTYNPWRGKGRSAVLFREAMGTPWIPMGGGASRKIGVTGDLFNAIPPAFTEWIGGHLMEVVRRGHESVQHSTDVGEVHPPPVASGDPSVRQVGRGIPPHQARRPA